MQDTPKKIPFTQDDIPFLEKLYATSRETEMAKIDWPDSEKTACLASQFKLQLAFYTQYYQHDHFYVLWQEDKPVGRLFIHENPSSWQLVDITLLPECRGQGLGTALIKSLQATAKKQNKRVDLHVEPYNPALKLYQRLGFVEQGVEGAYYKMSYAASRSTLKTAS